jgi:cbb3-type cytochrome oxidase subunit 1
MQEDQHAPMAVNPRKLRPYDQPPKQRSSLLPSGPDAAATAFLVASVIWFLMAGGIGTLWAAMQLFPDQLTFSLDVPLLFGSLSVELSPATVTSGFWNALVFGWISNAAFGAILFITPRVTGQRLVDEQFGTFAAGLWNVGALAGLACVYVPSLASTGTLAEFPLPVDALLLLALVYINSVFWWSVLAARREPYASVWFFGVALLGFTGLYAVATIAPLLGFADPFSALVNAAYARGIETIWVLGVAYGTLHYLVPRATGNPLQSSGVAFLGWFAWAAFATLSLLGALTDASVPFAATLAGNAGTILLLVPAFLTVANLLQTMRGKWARLLSPGTVQFAMVALAFLVANALLEAVLALGSVRGLVGGTEWVTGVRLFAFLGTGTFSLLALADHAFPRLLHRSWGDGMVATVALWATFAGTAVTGLALLTGGLIHGSLLRDGAAAEEIQPWVFGANLVAGAGLGLVALGALAAALNLFLLYTEGRRADYAPAGAPATAAGGH